MLDGLVRAVAAATTSLPPANEVCEGYVFTGLSVCPQGWNLSGRPSPWTVMCGRYASYWNAFLFYGQLATNFILRPVPPTILFLRPVRPAPFYGQLASSTLILWSVRPTPLLWPFRPAPIF